MIALKKRGPHPGLDWCPETPVPPLGPRDVLVRVTHVGVCGTDRHIYEWNAWSASRVRLGVTVGHEFVGRVAAVGEAVDRLAVGDRVSAEGHIGCGVCQPCRTGRSHICEKVDILGIDIDGCFAEFVSLPENNVWPVHPAIPDHIAAVFDPLGNAVHAVMASGVSGRSLLITGVGIIGLMAVTVARAAGASKIVVTDTDGARLALAMELGADHAFHAKDAEWPAEARRITGGQGPEVFLEMSGDGTALRQGLGAVRNGGIAALLGLPPDPVTLDLPNDIIFKGLTVLGINGRRIFQTWYQVENFVLSGRLQLEAIITHQLPLRDYERAFSLMQSGEGIKVVLEMRSTPVS